MGLFNRSVDVLVGTELCNPTLVGEGGAVADVVAGAAPLFFDGSCFLYLDGAFGGAFLQGLQGLRVVGAERVEVRRSDEGVALKLETSRSLEGLPFAFIRM